jgi:hypothetical protein
MEKVKFSENNSGGDWWLSKEQYEKLFKAGWKPGTTAYDDSIRSCSKDFETFSEAIEEWEELTGEDASAEGCDCCGPPYSFSSDNNGCSGEGCLRYSFVGKNTPKPKRKRSGGLE